MHHACRIKTLLLEAASAVHQLLTVTVGATGSSGSLLTSAEFSSCPIQRLITKGGEVRLKRAITSAFSVAGLSELSLTCGNLVRSDKELLGAIDRRLFALFRFLPSNSSTNMEVEGGKDLVLPVFHVIIFTFRQRGVAGMVSIIRLAALSGFEARKCCQYYHNDSWHVKRVQVDLLQSQLSTASAHFNAGSYFLTKCFIILSSLA